MAGMEDPECAVGGSVENCDGEEDFRSCCAEEEEWKEAEEHVLEVIRNDLDEFSWRMFFKGVSVSGAGVPASGVSGIGIVMEGSPGTPAVRIQKKLDFHVEPAVAELLALLDGLLEALRGGVARKIVAFTDSEVVYTHVGPAVLTITQGDIAENDLLVALGQRIMEHTDKLEAFSLNLVPSCRVEEPLHLAQEAAGVLHLFPNGDGGCSICHAKKHPSQMVTMHCSHKICCDCVVLYIQGKLRASQIPIKCPKLRCEYYICPSECKSFLPVHCYESFERTLILAEAHDLERMFCPFPDCSAVLHTDHLTIGENSSNQSEDNCLECQECHRLVCIDCGVPWHLSMTCEEYQNLTEDERDVANNALHQLVNSNNYRQCEQCRRIIECTQGCYYMACWCGHEFCYSCGSEYRGGHQTCQCIYAGENYEPSSPSDHDPEFWRWDFFDSPVGSTYTEQERSQLALIQRFLAGGFGSGDQSTYHSPPRCSDTYIDAIKDLHQLPWLERFVSVISDNYHEDYTQ